MKRNDFEIIIIGGSYAGLSAAMALGRALRKVLIIDSGKPCNRQTPHSHNFLTQDGNSPGDISGLAKDQVLQYNTVQFFEGTAVAGARTEAGFQITAQQGETFTAGKLIFATGIKDLMPDIRGFRESWGISVIHCPYCHGYEVRNAKTGILANGATAFEMGKLIYNWTRDLTIYTNGKSDLSREQRSAFTEKGIVVVEDEIDYLEHASGQLHNIVLRNGSSTVLTALYARLPFVQHCDIPITLGCELNEQGYLKTDSWHRTSVAGIYACGDNVSPMRSVASAVYAGSFVGSILNKELIEEEF